MLKNIFCTLFFVLIATTLVSMAYHFFKYDLSEKEAIELATSFARKVRLEDRHPFSVKDKTSKTIGLSTGKDKLFAVVSKKNKEVIQLGDAEPVEQARELLHTGKWKGKSTALFIDAGRAKASLMEIATQIGLPGDTVVSGISLDKYSGLWTAKWTRRYEAYVFNDDYIIISISAVSGDFCNYIKKYETEDFSTKVELSQEEAIKIGLDSFSDYFTKDAWEKNKEKFEVKTAELRIVKPDESWKHFIPFYRPRARLAWVLILDAKEGEGRNTVGILIKDKSTLIIDAASGNILSKEINIVP